MKVQPHDTVYVEGVHSIHPVTGADTGLPRVTVVLSLVAFRYWPLFLTDGPYRNVTQAPAPDSRITHINAVPVAEPMTWADVAGHEDG